jgi:ribosomal protein L16 Arg81 hydroxylase
MIILALPIVSPNCPFINTAQMFVQVDLDNVDLKEFPRVENLDFLDCILEEGDLLYIPPKWWHYVRSLSISFSVSFWWRSTVVPSKGS